MIRPPRIQGLTPTGDAPATAEPVLMLLEEYEAIRLCDYELKTQAEAAGMMRISRPTFTRIYESARRKMALVLTEGRVLRIEGGKVVIDAEWSYCCECDSLFNNVGAKEAPECCPLCGSTKIGRCP